MAESLQQVIQRVENERSRLTCGHELTRDHQQVSKLSSEVHCFEKKIIELQARDRCFVQQTEAQFHQIRSAHRLILKSIGLKQLFRSLEQKVDAKLRNSFQTINKYTSKMRCCRDKLFFKGLRKMRGWATHERHHKQSQIMLIWFQKVFQPRDSLRINRKLNAEQLRACGQALVKRSKQRLSRLHKSLKRRSLIYSLFLMESLARRFKKRRQLRTLQLWQTLVLSKGRTRKQLLKSILLKLMKKKRSLKYMSFHQWLSFNVLRWFEQKTLKSRKILMKQTRSKQVWQTLARNKLEQKVRHRSRYVRTFKKFKVGLERKRMRTFCEKVSTRLTILKQKIKCQQALMQLRTYTTIQKHKKATDKLTKLNKIIDTVQLQNTIRLDKINTKKVNFLVKSLHHSQARNLLAHLRRWQASTSVWRDLKCFMRKRYFDKLEVAFNWLKVKANVCKRHCLEAEVASISQSSYDIRNEGYLVNHQSYQPLIRRRNQHLRKLRRLFAKKQTFWLKYWIRKWRSGCTYKVTKLRAVQLLLTKAKHCLLRTALLHYNRKSKEHANLALQVDELASRVHKNFVRTYFRAISDYSFDSKANKRILKVLVLKVNKHLYRAGLSKWLQDTLESKLRQKLNQKHLQGCLVSNLTEEYSALNLERNKHQSLASRYQKLSKDLATNILLTQMLRSHRYSLKYGIQNWRQNAETKYHKAKFAYIVKRMMDIQYIKLAWFRWDHLFAEDRLESLKEKAIRSDKQKEQFALDLKNDKIDLHKQQIKTTESVGETKEDFDLIEANRKKLLSLMYMRHKKNIHIFRLRFITNAWRSIVKKEMKSAKNLHRAIKLLWQQKAFTKINEFSREPWNTKVRSVRKVLRLAMNLQLKVCFDRWRTRQYEMCVQGQIQQKSNQANYFFDYAWKIKFIKTHHAVLMNNRSVKAMKQKLFNALHEFSYNSRVLKEQTRKCKSVILAKKGKRWILKLKNQILTQQKQKWQIEQTTQSFYRIYRKPIFQQMKQEWFTTTKLLQKGRRIQNVILNFFKSYSFGAIKHHAINKYHEVTSVRAQQEKVWTSIQNNIRTRRLREAVYKMQLDGERRRKTLRRFRFYLVLNSSINNKLRHSFFAWARFTESERCVAHHEDQVGPVCVQNWLLRLKLNALSAMMIDDGASDMQIRLLLIQKKRRYEDLIQSSLCRISIFRDLDMRVLCKYFDRLKAYRKFMVRLRAVIRAYINRSKTPSVSRAFLIWKSQKSSTQLHSVTAAELKDRSSLNHYKLIRCSQGLDSKINTMNTNEYQIEYFWSKVPGCTKLAFSLMKSNQMRIAHQSLNKMSDNAQVKLRKELTATVNNNLKVIESYKQKILDVEQENFGVCAQSDQVRPPAVKAYNDTLLKKAYLTENQALVKQRYALDQQIKELLEHSITLKQKLRRVNEQVESGRTSAARYRDEQHYLSQSQSRSKRREERASVNSERVSSIEQTAKKHSPHTVSLKKGISQFSHREGRPDFSLTQHVQQENLQTVSNFGSMPAQQHGRSHLTQRQSMPSNMHPGHQLVGTNSDSQIQTRNDMAGNASSRFMQNNMVSERVQEPLSSQNYHMMSDSVGLSSGGASGKRSPLRVVLPKK